MTEQDQLLQDFLDELLAVKKGLKSEIRRYKREKKQSTTLSNQALSNQFVNKKIIDGIFEFQESNQTKPKPQTKPNDKKML